MTRNPLHRTLTAITALIAASAVLVLLTLPAGAASGGATPGLAKYNAFVVQLHNVGCTPLWVSWGSSYWNCPPSQRWVVKYYERTDTATLRRVR